MRLCEDCKVELNMSGREKGKAKGTTSRTGSAQADLHFPAARIHRLLLKGHHASRVRLTDNAEVFLF